MIHFILFGIKKVHIWDDSLKERRKVMPKLITVVICTYNGEKYLKEVIESILIQDGFDEYVEKVVIVDNASNDNTKKIILDYQKNYSKVEYIYEEKPGLSHARKHGAVVDSKWVVYLDDDNILLQGWVMEAVKFITQHPKVGVFNGVSIAIVRHSASEEEINMLKAIYKNLACTHCCIEDYNRGVQTAINGPFGAGMFLLTKPLQEFLNEGWTKNIGRKGKELSSGEDGEIADAVLGKGYVYAFNNNMALYHVMPRQRLQMAYAQKLMEGLNIGYYVYISEKKNYIYFRVRTFLKSILVIIGHPVKLIFTVDPVLRIKAKLDYESRLRMIKLVLRDFFILKR
jgi:glycosyltransferase involved in cell wall biosynthesis